MGETETDNLSEFFGDSTKQQKAKCVIPCNFNGKIAWDLFIMVVLLFTTAIIPIRLAFVEEEVKSWETAFYAIDLLFFMDIILWFFTSYIDDH